MSYSCEICNIDLTTEAALKAHKTSEKHLNRAEAFHSCLLEAAHSVHVTGFSRNVGKDALYNYFMQFGKVVDVTYVDQNNSWGPFAFVKFENLAVASHVLRYKQHCFGKHFIRVQPKRMKFNAQLPYRPGQSGQRKVSPLKKRGKHIQPLEQVHVKDIIANLQKEILEKITVDEQIMLLFKQLRLTDKELQKRDEFCKLFRNILNPYFPGCSVSLFGSSVNGFGVRGCDIDVFLDLHRPMPKDLKEQSDDASASLKFIKNQAVPMDEFLQLTAYKQVRFLQKILSKHLRDTFGNFFPIPSVQCPIVRFIHKKSNITFDLSLQNKNGLHNTVLLKYFSSYDWRVAPLVCIIRLWAKYQKLASIGGTSFSSYSITLLILFFLQNTQPAVLPSVKELIELCTPEERNIVDDCNYSCPKRPPEQVLPASKNTDNLETLLNKFFDFYLHIDYESTVISTHTGQLLPRSDFENDPELKTFKLSSVCVQDPYILVINTAGNVTDKVKMDFIKGLFKAQTQLSAPKSDKNLWGIPSILVVEEPPPKGRERFKERQSFAQPILLNFPINVCRLNKHLTEFSKKSECNQLLWCQVFCVFLKTVLSDLLLIECSKTCDIDSSILNQECSNEEFPSKGGKKKRKKTKDVRPSTGNESETNVTPGILKLGDILKQSQEKKEEEEEEEEEMLKENLKNLDQSSSNSSETAMNVESTEGSDSPVTGQKDSNLLGDGPSSDAVTITEVHEGVDLLSDIGTKRKQGNAKELIDLVCTVKHHIWFNRKNVRQKLIAQGDCTPFELEKKISNHIISAEKDSTEKPITIFRLNVIPDVEYMNLTSVSVHITPVLTSNKAAALKPSHGIYDFLISFLNRMISSHFTKWCISNCTDDLNFSSL
ncbi:speckle targeted PIP5K1A-regulated poly(A) polymerase isoform X2 [Octopus sinensis]|uniref:Speckle targeted PIP5K1A-regulated poly(A) polymerase n=1 Tax=Octopus sinensis TaxID=2607531 RepID=A0A6P7S7H2_9MOLL|nr:speckle targeted PIP5K1A-regulated poly(A) polymerase isoform X2 [Octopus sinensis]